MKKEITVVAAIIENEHSEILCALRSPSMSLPNLWEFPGGKVEPGEDHFTAIEREIEEELLCNVQAVETAPKNTHEYSTFIIHLYPIKCKVFKGNPVETEHSKLIWLKRDNLDSLKWAPADVPIVKNLIKEV